MAEREVAGRVRLGEVWIQSTFRVRKTRGKLSGKRNNKTERISILIGHFPLSAFHHNLRTNFSLISPIDHCLFNHSKPLNQRYARRQDPAKGRIKRADTWLGSLLGTMSLQRCTLSWQAFTTCASHAMSTEKQEVRFALCPCTSTYLVLLRTAAKMLTIMLVCARWNSNLPLSLPESNRHDERQQQRVRVWGTFGRHCHEDVLLLAGGRSGFFDDAV